MSLAHAEGFRKAGSLPIRIGSQHPVNTTSSSIAGETLDKALSRIWETEWMHKRSGPTLKSQAESAAKAVAYWAYQRHAGLPVQPSGSLRVITVAEVTPADIQQATKAWYIGGLSPATITKRLNCLSKLGVNVEGCKVTVPNQLKWWLKPSDEREVIAWLARVWGDAPDGQELAYMDLSVLIGWTTKVGTRTEETLRLKRRDFSEDYREVSVPGTKTANAQATLPLPSTATDMIAHEFLSRPTRGRDPDEPLIGSTYEELRDKWEEVREQFGFSAPTATLKALRRSAARYLHIDCGMPLHMVQQYLRHESMETTLEYLRLTGGYGTEEMRRYLK